jgi:hypothetical protein
MATYSKKSLLTLPQLFVVTLIALVIGSCNDPKENGEWIPVPKDTSALARVDHFIPIEDINQYKKDYATLRDSFARSAPTLFLPTSEAFNKPQVLEVLKDPKCVGLRVYYGLKSGKQNEFRMIIVGVDSQGKDLYIQKGGQAAAQTTPIGSGGLEFGQCDPPCPSGR